MYLQHLCRAWLGIIDEKAIEKRHRWKIQVGSIRSYPKAAANWLLCKVHEVDGKLL